MLLIGQSLLLVLLFAINSLGTGLLILRRVRLKPQERLCAAVGVSLFITYCIAFLIYMIKAPLFCYWAISLIGALATIVTWRDIKSMWRGSRIVRAQLKAFLLLFIFSFCMLALIRHYSGGLWAGDFLEHFERTNFFLEHHKYNEIFIEVYSLPARPPMMNIIAAGYLAQVGNHSFSIFSQIFLLLNLLVVLPCVLMLPMLGARRLRTSLAALLLLLAANPMFLENLTWTWTKLLAAFYILLGLWFYLRGWRKGDSVRTILAFVLLAIGMIVHYSAGPYIVVFLVHYACIFFFQRPIRWRDPIIAGVISAAILLTWIGWSLAIYGPKTTFGSNTTVTGSETLSAEGNVSKFFGNLWSTIAPFNVRIASTGPKSFHDNFAQDSPIGYFRDYTFCIYQHNFIFSMGVIGGFIAIALFIVRMARRSGGSWPIRIFWMWFIVASIMLGIAVHGTYEELGIAHICLQPLTLLGIAFLAANLMKFWRWFRIIIVIACCVDFTIGVFVQATLEHRSFVYVTLRKPDGTWDKFIVGGGGLNVRAARNWNTKEKYGLHYLGDDLQRLGAVLQIIFVELFVLLLFLMWCRCIIESPDPVRARGVDVVTKKRARRANNPVPI